MTRSKREWPEATAHDLLEALRMRTDFEKEDQRVFLANLAPGTGSQATRFLDAWSLEFWLTNKYEATAYEIKVSRGDFLREIKYPQKRAAALSISNRFYFVTPPGLVRASEIPEECGLIEIGESLNRRTVVKAPWREMRHPDVSLIASIARNIRTDAERRAIAKMTHLHAAQKANLLHWQQEHEAAQERARIEWEKVGHQRTAARNERDAIDALRKEMGLAPVDWQAATLRAEEAYNNRYPWLAQGHGGKESARHAEARYRSTGRY